MGTTWAITLVILLRQAHPYIHGDYVALSEGLRRNTGSSLHTWGLLRVEGNLIVNDRLIPTYTGTIVFIFLFVLDPRVHPYIHGDYWFHSFAVLEITGSSSHTWGLLIAKWLLLKSTGLIPTYTGTIRGVESRCSRSKAHPHIHGDY